MTSAPHHRATPVTRTLRFFAIPLSLWIRGSPHPAPAIVRTNARTTRAEVVDSPDYHGKPFSASGEGRCSSVRALDDVAFHEGHCPRHRIMERRLRLPDGELELAEERIEGFHRLDRVADVDVRRKRDAVERLSRSPAIGEV